MTASGLTRAAILFLSLNDQAKSALLEALNNEDIQRLNQSIKVTGAISAAETTEITTHFSESLLQGVVGVENALKAYLPPLRQSQFEKPEDTAWTRLEALPNALLVENLSKERAEVVAVLLSKISKEKAAKLLSLFNKNYAAELLLHLAKLKPVNEAVIAKATDETIISKLNALDFRMQQSNTVSLLEMLSPQMASGLLQTLAVDDKNLALTLANDMLTFAKITQLEGQTLRRLLEDIPPLTLAESLVPSSNAERQIFMLHLSKNAAYMVEDELELLTDLPQDMSQNARAWIVARARLLLKERENA